MDADAHFDTAVLGLVLPPGVEAALAEAGRCRADPVAAMAALMCAQALAAGHSAALLNGVPLRAQRRDADWTVRWEAAGRAIGTALERLLHDQEPEVRERAAARRDELECAHG
ncbi:hypothetical protein [Azohydromonas caseinilytica]|uniref:Uncharacterized protein n=1 Tax=Azohydromonas caseinilytica TaxID=2728836 RepID=A0A848FD00_9BURK|nr:hypothetical protein [Azohydromonas caseinilytica]NML16163.1 hypothetical protein [Azohydromonas caseinilytica]